MSAAPVEMPPLQDEPLNGALLPDGSYSFASAADDGDADGYASSVDNCEADFNPFQTDSNGNGIGDACELVPVPAARGAGLALLAGGLWLINIRRRRVLR